MARLLIIFCFLFPLPLLAQFGGGPGDGFDQKQESALSLGGATVSFGGFNGGNGDGFDTEQQVSTSLSGSTVSFNGFNGGIGDGFAFENESSKTLGGVSYTYGGFNGGTGDGFATTIQSSLILQNTPLQIYWIDFTAHDQKRAVLLQWELECTDDLVHFEIERSADAQKFEKISELKTLNSFDNQYQTYDYDPIIGNNYYRIKHLGTDGSIGYTQVEKITFNEKTTQPIVTIYPNPNFEKVLWFDIKSIPADKLITINIYNSFGAIIKSYKATNKSKLKLDNAWTSGIYWIEFIINQETSLRKSLLIK